MLYFPNNNASLPKRLQKKFESRAPSLPEPVPWDPRDGLEAGRGAEGRHGEDGPLHSRHPPHILQRAGIHSTHGRAKAEGWANLELTLFCVEFSHYEPCLPGKQIDFVGFDLEFLCQSNIAWAASNVAALAYY